MQDTGMGCLLIECKLINMKFVMIKKTLFIVLILVISNSAMAQKFKGVVRCTETKNAIAYVNIGVIGKGIGTVSGSDGRYALDLEPQYALDTLMFSCIGYHPLKITVAEFGVWDQHHITLQKRVIELEEVVVRPFDYRKKLLGNTTRSKSVMAGFKENQLGYELGIIIKIKKPSFLEKVNINIASASYDTLFYRLNVYTMAAGSSYQNILHAPIYLELPADKLTQTIEVDLRPFNIKVDSDVLITLEHVKDLGPGHLYFSAGLSGRTHYRKTSQAKWESKPVGIGISVDILEEK